MNEATSQINAVPASPVVSSKSSRRAIGLAAFAGLMAGLAGWYFWPQLFSRSDLDRLQGEWQIQAENPDAVIRVRIQGNRWTYVAGGRELMSQRIDLNPQADPKEIELVNLLPDGKPMLFTDGQGKGLEVKQLGIYSLSGDTLVIVRGPATEGQRPRALDDPTGPPPLILTRGNP